MTFAAYESTPHFGNPVELFEFTLEGVTYRYVHYDDDVTVDGYVWQAAYLARTRFSRGDGTDKASITISTSLEWPFLSVFSDGYPESRIGLSIYRTHLSDPDLEKRLIWDGQVLSRKFSGKGVELSCEVPEVSFGTLGLRRRFQRNCPFPLYSTSCRVNKELHKLTAQISSVSASGVTIGISGTDCTEYAGGFFNYQIPNFVRKVFITSGGQDYFTIQQPSSWIVAGITITMYLGCNKTTSACESKFSNLNNFGGFPGLPRDNLFNTQAF
jgi:uncharacterized phage protein (TIGR02218 family)